jgi:hypothetical protein
MRESRGPARPRFPFLRSCATELVHWVARRLSTGEDFAMFVAPRNPLAAGTEGHSGIAASVLRGGAALADFRAAWRAFVRDTDVLCAWGPYVMSLLAGSGGFVPHDRFDLRARGRLFAKGAAGSPHDFARRFGVPVAESTSPGRALSRLESVVAVARYFQGGS